MSFVFIPKNAVQTWIEDGRAMFDDDEIYLLEENLKIPVVPAVRFLEVVEPDEDSLQLVGKIKTLEQLEEMDAEHFMDSVTIDDIAYTVIEGSKGEVALPDDIPQDDVPSGTVQDAVSGQAALATPEGPTKQAANPTVEEAEALSKLFLNTVR